MPNPVRILPPPGILSGVVRDSSIGSPISEATVVVRRSEQIVAQDTTDSDGSFSVELPPQIYNAHASKLWYYSRAIDSVTVLSAETTNVNIALRPEIPSAITGYITELTDSTLAIPGAIVRILYDGIEVGQDTSDENGVYLVYMLHEGLHSLVVNDSGFAEAAIDSIWVGPAETTMVDIRMMHNCSYILGDMNGNGVSNGIDIVYAVNYFRGRQPGVAYPCNCPPMTYPFYSAGDVNADCVFNGMDLTYRVNYFKGIGDSFLNCPLCPEEH